jgi:beta-glucosidase
MGMPAGKLSLRRARRQRSVVALVMLGAFLPLAGTSVPALEASAAEPQTCAPNNGMAWMNTSQTPIQRARELLKVMTLTDKTDLTQEDAVFQHYGVAGYIASPDTSLCIPDLVLNDGGQGVGDLMTGTTPFPAPIAQSASWDPKAQKQLGAAIGAQAHTKGVNVQLAPGIETDRVPIDGRNFEYFSEDPYLAGQTAAAFVRGIQSQHVIATIKHFIGNSQETNRKTESDQVDERTLQEMYLPQYAAGIQQGGAGAVMCSYNRINTAYACEDGDTQITDLRDQIGFKGMVISDWGAVHGTTLANVNAGLDMENDSDVAYGTNLATAVQDGQVSMAQLNAIVLDILEPMFAVGLFDHPIAMGTKAQAKAAAVVTDTPSQVALAEQVAEDGTVLLKDDDQILPLGQPSGQTIAVIGMPASQAGAELTYEGNGSAHVPELAEATDIVSPLTGMQAAAATYGDTVTYAAGTAPGFADAIDAAKTANVAVVFVYDQESEGVDRANLALPPDGTDCNLAVVTGKCVKGKGYDQKQLVEAVAAANPNTVVVVQSGGPVVMPWVDQVRGIVEAWYGGQDEGDAIASVLFGGTDPSGHLPETFPSSMSQLPTAGSAAQYPGVSVSTDPVGPEVSYTEGLNVGYRWYEDMGLTPLFPFGYGLSYTTFRYSDYTVTSAGPAGPAAVSFDLTNTGTTDGAEVAQAYVGSPADNYAEEPLYQLRGYQKVFLMPGQTQRVTIPLDPHSASYWDTATGSWQPETGCHPVWVGSSSNDIELQGAGLNGGLQAVEDCPASASTYTVTSGPYRGTRH